MRPALLLIDLQRDFLGAPSLEPAAGAVVDRAAALLAACRRAAVPVVHVWTTVRRDDDRRMPHWRSRGLWLCEEGTAGHAAPAKLEPRDGETVVHKTDYSAFGAPPLERLLRDLGVDTVLISGVHLHACVRAMALDGYARRLDVWVAEDAVASDDPLHAAMTRAYLSARCIRFRPVDDIVRALEPPAALPAPGAAAPLLPALVVDGQPEGAAGDFLAHEAPAASGTVLWRVPVCGAAEVGRVTAAARRAAAPWAATTPADRQRCVAALADRVADTAAALAAAIVGDVGKPIAQARAEVAHAVTELRDVAARGGDAAERRCGGASRRRDCAHGVVGIVTPWNNPLSIPAGKLGAALLHGNVVVWKPAPAASALAVRLLELVRLAGFPPGAAGLCCGDHGTAMALMADPEVDAVSFSGSSLAGYAAQAICGRRRIPLQAELGGNNAALVAADADLAAAAALVAAGAFEFAGQRCTANRRVIVERRCLEAFESEVAEATARLAWGRPAQEATRVGPVIGAAARARIEEAVARALAAGARRLGRAPEDWPEHAALTREGSYLPPVIVRCEEPDAEIVREETFGPVLVVQPAGDWEEAVHLANGVRQGLVAAAFTHDPGRRGHFLRAIRAGIVKLDQSTAGADAVAPFGGWKASGVGPPEHGESDRLFFTRPQAVYE